MGMIYLEVQEMRSGGRRCALHMGAVRNVSFREFEIAREQSIVGLAQLIRALSAAKEFMLGMRDLNVKSISQPEAPPVDPTDVYDVLHEEI